MITIKGTPLSISFKPTSHLDCMNASLWHPSNHNTIEALDLYVSTWVHMAERLQSGDWYINLVAKSYYGKQTPWTHNAHFHYRALSKSTGQLLPPKIGNEETYFLGNRKYRTLSLKKYDPTTKNINKVIAQFKAIRPELTVYPIEQIKFNITDLTTKMKARLKSSFDLNDDYTTKIKDINVIAGKKIDSTLSTNLILGLATFLFLNKDDKKKVSSRLILK